MSSPVTGARESHAVAVGLRGSARRLARRAGLEEQALTLYEAALRTVRPRDVRRNLRDDDQVRLLAAAVLAPDSNCVDVGANAGRLLAVFDELAPAGRHIAYEPLPQLHAVLRRRFPRVDVRGTALADHPGEAVFLANRRRPSRSSLEPVGHARGDLDPIRVRVETLDASLPAGYVPSLVKIDVEGAESLVLAGAMRTLQLHRPVVLFEHQRRTARHFGGGPDQLFELLVGGLGMRIFDMDGVGPYSLADLRHAYETGRRWNFFAVPGRRDRA